MKSQNGHILIYLYCITAEPPMLNKFNVAKELYVIESNGLYITVKDVSDKDYSESNIKAHLSDESWLDIQVREHISVIETIMEDQTVVPFNFCTIYTSEETLNQFLDKFKTQLSNALTHLHNKEEWSLKAYCDKNEIVKNIDILCDEIADIDFQIQSSLPGKSYILNKKRRELIAKEITEIYNSYSRNVFLKIRPLSEEYKYKTLLSNDQTGKNNDMILNATFLIKKDNVNAFIESSEALILEYRSIGLEIEITGPWPPYEFINVSY